MPLWIKFVLIFAGGISLFWAVVIILVVIALKEDDPHEINHEINIDVIKGLEDKQIKSLWKEEGHDAGNNGGKGES